MYYMHVHVYMAKQMNPRTAPRLVHAYNLVSAKVPSESTTLPGKSCVMSNAPVPVIPVVEDGADARYLNERDYVPGGDLHSASRTPAV